MPAEEECDVTSSGERGGRKLLDCNSGANTVEPPAVGARNPDGTFAPGNPGKPRGARHRATVAAQALLDGEAEALTRKAVEQALAGDTAALRLCLDRIAPRRTDAPITFSLPPLQSAEDAVQAATALLQAVSEGELTPSEGAQVMALVETFRRTLELTDVERRLRELEEVARGPT